LSPTRGTMPTRAPGGNTGSAAGAGFVAAIKSSAAANKRRIKVMKILSVCMGSRSVIGRPRPLWPSIPRSVGPLLAVLPSRQQGGCAFVPERIVARAIRAAVEVQAMFSPTFRAQRANS
jgi:hypothetical protein